MYEEYRVLSSKTKIQKLNTQKNKNKNWCASKGFAVWSSTAVSMLPVP